MRSTECHALSGMLDGRPLQLRLTTMTPVLHGSSLEKEIRRSFVCGSRFGCCVAPSSLSHSNVTTGQEPKRSDCVPRWMCDKKNAGRFQGQSYEAERGDEEDRAASARRKRPGDDYYIIQHNRPRRAFYLRTACC